MNKQKCWKFKLFCSWQSILWGGWPMLLMAVFIAKGGKCICMISRLVTAELIWRFSHASGERSFGLNLGCSSASLGLSELAQGIDETSLVPWGLHSQSPALLLLWSWLSSLHIINWIQDFIWISAVFFLHVLLLFQDSVHDTKVHLAILCAYCLLVG